MWIRCHYSLTSGTLNRLLLLLLGSIRGPVRRGRFLVNRLLLVALGGLLLLNALILLVLVLLFIRWIGRVFDWRRLLLFSRGFIILSRTIW